MSKLSFKSVVKRKHIHTKKRMFGKRYRNCVKAEEGRMLEADLRKERVKSLKGSVEL